MGSKLQQAPPFGASPHLALVAVVVLRLRRCDGGQLHATATAVLQHHRMSWFLWVYKQVAHNIMKAI